MKTCHCHRRKIAPPIGGDAHQPPAASRRRWGGEIAGWIIPGVTLVLLPKCPICMAAYVALFSGVSLSFASASHLRTSLQIVCVTALFFLVMKRLCRLVKR
jgi:hypothetical protein